MIFLMGRKMTSFVDHFLDEPGIVQSWINAYRNPEGVLLAGSHNCPTTLPEPSSITISFSFKKSFNQLCKLLIRLVVTH